MAIVINDLVGYKNMKIVQNTEYFNFSLESVILPHFCNLTSKIKTIVDFCTGNAPIPLILSTMTNAKIIGVEIQEKVCELANESIKINNLEDQINILNLDINHLNKYIKSDSVDLITCNPPYFKIEKSSNFNKNMVKSVARHEICVTLQDICNMAKKILKNGCSLIIVHRTERFTDVVLTLKKNNLEPKIAQFIYPKKNEESNLFLISAVKNGKVGLKVLKPLVCHNEDGTYTDEIIKMFER